MIRFVEKPHLPQGEVRQIIIGEKYKNVLENALFEQNIVPIWLKNNDFVDERLSGHCDLMAVHLGGNRLAAQSSVINNCKLINNIELICTENPMQPEYPHDVGLNICIVGEKLIYNPKSANAQIISQFGGTKLCCKQGYTKCSTCVVDENSIITSDNKIAAVVSATGMDVLQVSDKIVALDGFEHGFIGGASFKISRNKMAFTGVIADVCERSRIERFLNERDIAPVYLTNAPMFDIGSAIPITEEI